MWTLWPGDDTLASIHQGNFVMPISPRGALLVCSPLVLACSASFRRGAPSFVDAAMARQGLVNAVIALDRSDQNLAAWERALGLR